MQHPAFKRFAKTYLAELLSPLGTVSIDPLVPRNTRSYILPSQTNSSTQILSGVMSDIPQVMVSPEVEGEAEVVDLIFEPSTPRVSCGDDRHLLPQMTQEACIIHPYRVPPTASEMMLDTRNLFAWQLEIEESTNPEDRCEDSLPYLWMLVPSFSDDLIKGMGTRESLDYGVGVHTMPAAFRTIIVDIDRLPRERGTLWLRLLGSGSVQEDAIAQLLALDPDDPDRRLAFPCLQAWCDRLSTGEFESESPTLMQLLAQVH
jgi:hypothetical protein